jgi:hypothetical protein
MEKRRRRRERNEGRKKRFKKEIEKGKGREWERDGGRRRERESWRNEWGSKKRRKRGEEKNVRKRALRQRKECVMQESEETGREQERVGPLFHIHVCYNFTVSAPYENMTSRTVSNLCYIVVLTPCSLVGGYQRFGGTFCLQIQDPGEGISIFLRDFGNHIPGYTVS